MISKVLDMFGRASRGCLDRNIVFLLIGYLSEWILCQRFNDLHVMDNFLIDFGKFEQFLGGRVAICVDGDRIQMEKGEFVVLQKSASVYY